MQINLRVLVPAAVVMAVAGSYVAEQRTDAPTSRVTLTEAARASSTMRTVSGSISTAPPSATRASTAAAPQVRAQGATTTQAPAASSSIDGARLLQQTGPVALTTTLGPVPAEGSGLYGAPDRLSARRVSADPSKGNDARIKSGDTVRVHYKIYELTSGQEVESSPPDGVLVRMGAAQGETDTVGQLPRDVTRALGSARIGDRVEVVLPRGTDDLGPELDASAAYKMHITITGRS